MITFNLVCIVSKMPMCKQLKHIFGLLFRILIIFGYNAGNMRGWKFIDFIIFCPSIDNTKLETTSHFGNISSNQVSHYFFMLLYCFLESENGLLSSKI